MIDDLSFRQRRAVLAGGAVLGLAFLAYLAWMAIGFGGERGEVLFNSWVYDGILLGAALSCFARALMIDRERAGWGLLGLALAGYGAGEIYFSIAIAGGSELPVPSPADGLYLVFYGIAYVGLIRLMRARLDDFPPVRWLDGMIAGAAVASLAAALALEPIAAAGNHGDTAAVATNLSYPIADLTLLFLVVTVAALSGWRPGRSWLLLGVGLAVLAGSDFVYLFESARGTYVEGGPLDAAWPFGVLLLAAAAWVAPGSAPPARAGGARVAAVPAIAAVAAIGILFAGGYVDLPLAAELLALATLLAVVARLALSFRESQANLEASVRDSRTDALTGLGNRRRFMDDLEHAVGAPPRGHRLWLLALFDLDGFKSYNDAFGHPAGDALLVRLAGRLEAFVGSRGRAYRLGGDEFCLLAECAAADVDALIGGAVAALSERGEGFAVSTSRGSVLLPSEADSREAALTLADQRMYANKGRERASAGSQSRDVLLSALRERQPELHRQLRDAAAMSRLVAERLGLDSEQRDEVIRAAELHDTGKMAIPDAILHKPGPLEEAEWEFMRKQTLIGERIIAAAPALVPVARLVRSCHERWDGRGYPDGLAGKEIPLGSRIVAVCDAYAAMVAERPYSVAMQPARALAELRAGAGTQFDPAVVEAFAATVALDSERAPAP